MGSQRTRQDWASEQQFDRWENWISQLGRASLLSFTFITSPIPPPPHPWQVPPPREAWCRNPFLGLHRMSTLTEPCSKRNQWVDIVPRPWSSESHPILPHIATFPTTWCRILCYGKKTPGCTRTILWSAVNPLWKSCYEIVMLNCITSNAGKQRDSSRRARRDSWIRQKENIFTFPKTAGESLL